MHARVTRVQDFVTECWDYYRVHYTVDHTTLRVMNASRWKECSSMYTGRVESLTMARFLKMLPRFTKKNSRDSPRARVSPAGQPRNFHCF